MTKKFAELRQAVQQMSDGRDREIAIAMSILVSALEVGPDVDRLVQYTRYARDLVAAISDRMREADLWAEDLIDDIEWWEENGELRVFGLFLHAEVALGLVRREITSNGVKYFDARTGEKVHEWHTRD